MNDDEHDLGPEDLQRAIRMAYQEGKRAGARQTEARFDALLARISALKALGHDGDLPAESDSFRFLDRFVL